MLPLDDSPMRLASAFPDPHGSEPRAYELMQVYISARTRRMRENGDGPNGHNGDSGMNGHEVSPTRLSRGA